MSDHTGEGSSESHPKGRSRLFSRIKNIVTPKSIGKDNGTKPPATRALNAPSPTHIKNVSELVEDKTGRSSTTAQNTTPIGHATSTGQAVAFSEASACSEIISGPSVSDTALEKLSVSEPISNPSDTSQKAPIMNTPTMGPIRELWNEAYDDLRDKEGKLIKDYEAALFKNVGTLLGSTLALTGSRIGREETMARILKIKMEEVKKNEAKLEYGSHEVAIKDLAQPVVSIINWANDYISSALSANPYASIAWAGVSLLLPLVLNPSKQTASLAKGLDEISDLIARSTMREDLYAHRYESKSNEHDREDFLRSHIIYRETLKELYTRILKFQAVSVCYYSKNGLLRFGSDIVIWDRWDSSLADIQAQEITFSLARKDLKDIRDEEEFGALYERHKESIQVMTSMGGDVSEIRKAIEKDSQRRVLDAEREQEASQKGKLLRWLSSINPSENYNSARDKHKSCTGDWLVKDNKEFQDWKSASNSLLWLNGQAGSGKTVLSSSVINHLEECYDSDPETATAYFYFSFSKAEKQNTEGMLCSLIKQLCYRWCGTPDSIKALYRYLEIDHRPPMATLEDTLIATIRGFSKVYLVLDALDECPDFPDAPDKESERGRLLESLRRIHLSGSQTLHMLWTSRRETDIETEFKRLQSPSLRIDDIDLSTRQLNVDRDIGLYIDETFASKDYLTWPDEIKSEARNTLTQKAGGMFLYVAFQLNALRHLRRPGGIRDALNGLPEGLDATYERILGAIRPENEKQVKSMLKWLSFSLRPLLLDELAEIFILDPKIDIPFDYKERLFDAANVLEYIPDLVTKVPKHIDGYSDDYGLGRDRDVVEIRLAHFSIKEFLLST